MQVADDGRLVVRAPLRMPEFFIAQFVGQKMDWIDKTRRLLTSKKRISKQYNEGEQFLYLGQEYPLVIDTAARTRLSFENQFIMPALTSTQGRKLFESWYKVQAQKLFLERAHYFADKMNAQFKAVRLTNAKTRWGSCNVHGSLRLNWRLIMAPIEIIDYVVVHELAHTLQLNHSYEFWAIVERQIPDYKIKRKWLREKGHQLNV